MDGRTPPNSLDAEMSVLGAILLDNEVYGNLEGRLTAEHFYKEGHRKVFRAIERLHRRADPMDLVTLTEELRTAGDLESIGGMNYLIGLADSVPTAAYADTYARIVLEKATLRDLISAGGRIMQSAFDQAAPLEDILDLAEQAIFDLTTKKRRSDYEGMRTLVTETFAEINERFANPNPVSGLRTGFRELDQMTAGLQDSSLNVLAARPAMGKTAFAMTIALNAALKESASVGVFNFEMSGVQLVTRMLCSEARVDMSRVRNGQLSDRDFQRLADTAGRLSEAKIFIDDTADMTVMELRSRARRLMAEHDLDLLIIDYLQLMTGSSRSTSENRQQEISTISRGLKALARELDIPVLVLSQLSRAVEGRPNKRPMLSDLRECVTGDTLVDLADGRRVPIRELVGTTPDVLAVDEREAVTTARADTVWHVGRREVFAVTLASGRVRRTTARHRWYSYDGWKRLDELAAGDRVALASRLPASAAAVPLEDADATRLGRAIAGADDDADDRAVAPGGVRCTAPTRVPRHVYLASRPAQAALLRHLWAGAGSIDVEVEGRAGHAVRVTAASAALAEDVAALLLRQGVVAGIRHVPEPRRPGDRRWVVEVRGDDQQRRFLNAVGACGRLRAPAERLATALRSRQEATPAAAGLVSERGPVSAGTQLGWAVADNPVATGDTDLYWDTITAIEPAGTEDVYDLSVPGPASWLADGVVMHNSGAIEQDADLVMFIYRDEYYDQHSEKHGIAEVIIGKQRNGPTGNLELQFHNSHVRFNDLARQGD